MFLGDSCPQLIDRSINEVMRVQPVAIVISLRQIEAMRGFPGLGTTTFDGEFARHAQSRT
jgi:hypothetical protein